MLRKLDNSYRRITPTDEEVTAVLGSVVTRHGAERPTRGSFHGALVCPRCGHELRYMVSGASGLLHFTCTQSGCLNYWPTPPPAIAAPAIAVGDNTPAESNGRAVPRKRGYLRRLFR